MAEKVAFFKKDGIILSRAHELQQVPTCSYKNS